MAFNGYRLKINNNIFPDSYVAKGTYSIKKKPRIVEKWTDGNLIDHISMTDKTKTTISFSLRQHNSSDHNSIVEFFNNRYNISVQYYDDDTDTYKTGTFHIDDLQFSHMNVLTTSNLLYAATSIVMEEY